ncbi:MAG: HNH endonuclease [Paludibacteraceae bacterium]|nr:HNH endonuclease [Paludibacteraceae bacterium]MBQ9672610.1 HNH endonuclease [Prevotella sp.]
MTNINDFTQERTCVYKGEVYTARDNGAIMRHQRKELRKRKLDMIWSFGNPNNLGYLEYGGERVHRIVATAFHGQAPTDQHVVDHIDTNKQNNRPENLRWLTKLENILNNEITRKKVELICGSVEAFLNNPSLLNGYETEDKNFTWMKNVTPEEAKNCLNNWKHWAKTAAPNPDYKKEERHIGNWIFDTHSKKEPNHVAIGVNSSTSVNIDDYEPHSIFEDVSNGNALDTEEQMGKVFGKKEEKTEEEKEYDGLSDSLTSSALQRYWRTPTEFPCCPSEVKEDGLNIYKNHLEEGALFSSNKFAKYYVIAKSIIPDKGDLIVLCTNNEGENIFGAYALCSVKIENEKFVHMSIKRFGDKKTATSFFNLTIGKTEWTEDDVIMWDT